MTIRAVIFDLGGVLETERETGMDAKWETRLGLKHGELEERLFQSGIPREATLGKLSEHDVLQQLAGLFGLDNEQVREFMQDIWEQYEWNTELADFLQGLRPHYKTAILSNAWPDARREEQQRFHLDTLVDTIIYSFEEGLGKPDPGIYLIACDRLAVQPEEVIFLDNDPVIVAAAQDVGMRAIRFTTTAQAIADIQACLDSSAEA